MATYRRVWVRGTTCLLAAGLAVLGYRAIVAAPILAAVVLLLAVAGLRGRRRARALPAEHGSTLLAWAGQQGLDVQAGLFLPVGVLALVGLSAALGAAALQLMAFAALAGVPVLLDRVLPGRDRSGPSQWPWDTSEGEHLRETSVAVRFLPGPRDGERGPGRTEPGPGDATLAHLVDELLNASTAEQGGTGTCGADVIAPQEALTTAELCHAWSASCRALEMSDHAGERARIAAARARYLDALQERDPAGFARWVRSGQAAHRDPSAFFAPPASP